MLTKTCKRFSIKDISPDMICVEDIAHALAGMPRFNRHTHGWYSIAQHCVLMSELMERDGFGPKIQFEALHHDSTEAYIGDMPRPVKTEEVRRLEAFIWSTAIVPKFRHLPDTLSDAVEYYDKTVMITAEMRDLWTRYGCPNDEGDISYAEVPLIRPWDRDAAKFEFKKRHYKLLEKL